MTPFLYVFFSKSKELIRQGLILFTTEKKFVLKVNYSLLDFPKIKSEENNFTLFDKSKIDLNLLISIKFTRL